MSDTQGSHRRVSWPEAEPDPAPDPGRDPGGAPGHDPAPESGVPAPRGEGRAARRRKGADQGPGRRRAAQAPAQAPSAPVPAPAPAPAPDAEPDGPHRPTGRRRAPAAAAPAPPAPPAPEAVPGRPGGRRRAPAPPAPAEFPAEPAAAPPAPGPRRRRATRTRTTRAPGANPRDHWRRIVPQALVVAFLAGGTTAFVAADKAVRLTVDGVPRTLHTFAGSVDELLASEGLGVGPHDLVAPARGSALDDGEQIVVRYGRPLRLTLDGSTRQMWTTSGTVEGALRQLGVRVEGAYLSAPRTAPVPRSGLTLGVRTERGVTFMADGRERTIRTNAATVQEALDQAGITLRGEDTTSVPPDSFPRDGQTVTVLRITGAREVREERIPYTTERVEDDDLFTGTEVVERSGRPGARRVTYSLRTVNGVRQQPRKVAEEVVREPVGQLIRVGTKPMPTSVAGADSLNWGALAQCESGGRPTATDASGTYGGLYQFDAGTWQALGGSGRPQDAPAGEQTYRAKKLYVQRGASPWPHCGRRLL
ncbi:ubiquitin-like domain-containing protein [Streptomyces sp. NBC_00249]|uniref:resuscitation-promoting factor n=1 Tax=Streptomyces sp. NBC_00249 TaxID=2975690 RepID=UPI0022541EFD|nr:resuscitation-promoting factor [Streptomyces sp. NBC_00249]MCX5198946.1 ubiquitin-like domain-containing protein [Streptomyces sp. NBC_00249]